MRLSAEGLRAAPSGPSPAPLGPTAAVSPVAPAVVPPPHVQHECVLLSPGRRGVLVGANQQQHHQQLCARKRPASPSDADCEPPSPQPPARRPSSCVLGQLPSSSDSGAPSDAAGAPPCAPGPDVFVSAASAGVPGSSPTAEHRPPKRPYGDSTRRADQETASRCHEAGAVHVQPQSARHPRSSCGGVLEPHATLSAPPDHVTGQSAGTGHALLQQAGAAPSDPYAAQLQPPFRRPRDRDPQPQPRAQQPVQLQQQLPAAMSQRPGVVPLPQHAAAPEAQYQAWRHQNQPPMCRMPAASVTLQEFAAAGHPQQQQQAYSASSCAGHGRAAGASGVAVHGQAALQAEMECVAQQQQAMQQSLPPFGLRLGSVPLSDLLRPDEGRASTASGAGQARGASRDATMRHVSTLLPRSSLSAVVQRDQLGSLAASLADAVPQSTARGEPASARCTAQEELWQLLLMLYKQQAEKQQQAGGARLGRATPEAAEAAARWAGMQVEGNTAEGSGGGQPSCACACHSAATASAVAQGRNEGSADPDPDVYITAPTLLRLASLAEHGGTGPACSPAADDAAGGWLLPVLVQPQDEGGEQQVAGQQRRQEQDMGGGRMSVDASPAVPPPAGSCCCTTACREQAGAVSCSSAAGSSMRCGGSFPRRTLYFGEPVLNGRVLEVHCKARVEAAAVMATAGGGVGEGAGSGAGAGGGEQQAEDCPCCQHDEWRLGDVSLLVINHGHLGVQGAAAGGARQALQLLLPPLAPGGQPAGVVAHGGGVAGPCVSGGLALAACSAQLAEPHGAVVMVSSPCMPIWPLVPVWLPDLCRDNIRQEHSLAVVTLA